MRSYKYKSSGLCGTHYERLRRNGNLETLIEQHGMKGTPTYRSWFAMKRRCLIKDDKDYPNYGARGIDIDPRWIGSFKSFMEDMGLRPDGTTLDRIDNDLGYWPSNCRWGSQEQQNNNRRDNRIISYNNKTMTLAQWSRVLGINYQTLRSRLDKGWPVEEAFIPLWQSNIFESNK